MANPYRGEVALSIDGEPRTLRLTLGALAELEAAFGDEDMIALACRFQSGKLKAADAIRAEARTQGCTERTVHTVAGAHFDWSEVLASGGSLSLFADKQLIEVRVPSGKPGKDGSQALQQLAAAAQGNATVLWSGFPPGGVGDQVTRPLLDRLKGEFDLSYIFIAHDLPLVRDFADRVMVMQGGKVVETGRVREIFETPREEYTRNLLAASLDPDPGVQAERRLARMEAAK